MASAGSWLLGEVVIESCHWPELKIVAANSSSAKVERWCPNEALRRGAAAIVQV